MKKLALFLVIVLCFTLCGCPAAEPSSNDSEMLKVHITAGKIQSGMTAKDILVEVTVDKQPVPCRVLLTGFTSDGYYEMADDEPVPDPFLVRLDIYYSLPEGRTVDDIDVTMECDGGKYDGTGSVGNDDKGCVEAWSHAFYGDIPEENNPENDNESDIVHYDQIHVHTWVETNPSSISCTTDTVITYACTCGNGKQEIIPAPGHDMKDGAITKPTCTEKGYQTKRCSRCSYALTIETPATGHNWSDWIKDTGVLHKRTCSTCGALETAKHNIPKGDIICTDCGAAIIN